MREEVAPKLFQSFDSIAKKSRWMSYYRWKWAIPLQSKTCWVDEISIISRNLKPNFYKFGANTHFCNPLDKFVCENSPITFTNSLRFWGPYSKENVFEIVYLFLTTYVGASFYQKVKPIRDFPAYFVNKERKKCISAGYVPLANIDFTFVLLRHHNLILSSSNSDGMEIWFTQVSVLHVISFSHLFECFKIFDSRLSFKSTPKFTTQECKDTA